jgi:DNA-binding XRE family transcriptional regulator
MHHLLKGLVAVTYRVGKCLLRYHLAKKKMSQQELADRVDKTKQTISRYVNNQSVMSYETALNVARVLECDMEDLYEILE